MFGNDMFGHHLHAAGMHGHTSSFGQNNSPFSNTNHNRNSFGQGAGSFGSKNGYTAGMEHGYHGYGGNGFGHGYHGFFNRQKSLLADMTHSKSDSKRPWVFSSYSYPYGYHEEGVVSSMYDKPLEKVNKKPPSLMRQQSFSVADSIERKQRIPSFSSDPARMRSHTLGGTQAPPPSMRKLSRSLSIAEDITQPANMDLARPLMKRTHSMEVQKLTRRNSFSATMRNKIPTLNLVKKFNKHRKSSRSTSPTPSPDSERSPSFKDRDSLRSSVNSQISVSDIPRCNTLESQKSRNSDKSPLSGTSGRPKSSASDLDPNEKLILSLLNPPVPEPEVPGDVFDLPDSPRSSMSIKTDSQDTVIEAPIHVNRRMNFLRAAAVVDGDNVSMESGNSGRFTPRSHRSLSGSSKSSNKSQSPPRSPVPVANGFPYKPKQNNSKNPQMYADPSDSETSVYYDCPNPGSNANSPLLVKKDNQSSVPRRGKRRSAKRSRNLSSSTCTDGEETTSTCDTPPRTSFRDKRQKYAPPPYQDCVNECTQTGLNDDIHNSQTLKVRDIVNELNKNAKTSTEAKRPTSFRPRPSLKQLSTINSYSEQNSDDDNESPMKQQIMYRHSPGYDRSNELLAPQFEQELKSEPESNNIDSSESGYATSHIQLSPRDYELKVSYFVNSLPYNPDMAEQLSEVGDVIQNGSDNESDRKEKPAIYSQQTSDLSNVTCVSGSDSDNMSIDSNGNESTLEVMKILESPTEVRVRVLDELASKSNKSSPRSEQDTTMPEKTLKRKSDGSETELMCLQGADTKDGKDNASQKSNNSNANVKRTVDTVVHVTEPNAATETKVVRDSLQKANFYYGENRGWNRNMFSFSRQSTRLEDQYQSKCTNCIDTVLQVMNLILVASSAAIIGLGIWLLLKDFNVTHVTVLLGNKLLQVTVYVAVSGAGVALLAAFCLCCGLRNDKAGLGFYAIVLIGVIITFTTATVLSIIFIDRLRGVEYKFNFEDRLINMYGNNTEKNFANEYLTNTWDKMQQLFECCGATGDENATRSWAIYKKFAMWYRIQPLKATVYVPESCCKPDSNIAVCQGSDHNLLAAPVYGPPMQDYYTQRNPNLLTNGCYEYLSKYLTTIATYIAFTTGGLAALYLLVVLLTWVFCFQKKQDKEENPFDSEYDIEYNESDSDDMDTRGNTPTEETKFMTTPVVHTVTKGKAVPVMSANNHRGGKSVPMYPAVDTIDRVDEYAGDNSSSDSDGEAAVPSVSERRNRWLQAEDTAPHLLSIAIEEEDSNFEDSDENQNNSAYV